VASPLFVSVPSLIHFFPPHYYLLLLLFFILRTWCLLSILSKVPSLDFSFIYCFYYCRILEIHTFLIYFIFNWLCSSVVFAAGLRHGDSRFEPHVGHDCIIKRFSDLSTNKLA